jgi:leader peptidase (prepilin peptidase) / N-methyltransferase
VLSLLEQSPTTFIVVALLLGLLVGSFLNVVIYRLPIMLERQWRAQGDATATAGKSTASHEVAPFNLITPRSACPRCHAPIAAWQNVPVLSWLLLRGRCAGCNAGISARYPLVELLCALLSALVAWRLGFGVSALCALAVTWILIALTFIDLDHQLLPDSLTLPLLWLGLLASLSNAVHSGAGLPVDPRSAIIGAAAGYLSLWSVFQLFRLTTGKEGMGYGDFKLLAALGAWLGWQMLLPIVLLSAAVGAVVGLTLIALRKHQAASPMPFGPFLAGAGFLVMLWGQQWVARYLGLFGR